MRLALNRHPDTPCAAVTGIDVDIARAGGALELRYRATGTIADLRLPGVTAPTRADELWKHTCFEAFIMPLSGAVYREFNLAPSTQWAAYRFDAYRAGMRDADAAPHIAIRAGTGEFALQATLDIAGLTPARLGLSAVIEEMSGRKSYWALAHPPGKPDFHHPDCFAAQIAAASEP